MNHATLKHPAEDFRPRFKLSLLDTDWVEWLIIAVLCAAVAIGVALATGSILSAAIACGVLFCACSAVVATL